MQRLEDTYPKKLTDIHNIDESLKFCWVTGKGNISISHLVKTNFGADYKNPDNAIPMNLTYHLGTFEHKNPEDRANLFLHPTNFIQNLLFPVVYRRYQYLFGLGPEVYLWKEIYILLKKLK